MPHVPPQYTAWFDELSTSSGPIVGGKGANLGEMTRAGIPVPPGFVVTTAAFLAALDAGGVREELQRCFATAEVEQPQALADAADRMRALVRRAGVPDDVRAAVLAAYAKLGPDVAVAVRSSATSEDTGATSFAGMHETFTNVVGSAALLERLVDCWVSAYGPRVLSYRNAEGMREEPTIAVVVQRMIDSARSGVMFTADPATGKCWSGSASPRSRSTSTPSTPLARASAPRRSGCSSRRRAPGPPRESGSRASPVTARSRRWHPPRLRGD